MSTLILQKHRRGPGCQAKPCCPAVPEVPDTPTGVPPQRLALSQKGTRPQLSPQQGKQLRAGTVPPRPAPGRGLSPPGCPQVLHSVVAQAGSRAWPYKWVGAVGLQLHHSLPQIRIADLPLCLPRPPATRGARSKHAESAGAEAPARGRSHRPIPLTNNLAVETRGPAR